LQFVAFISAAKSGGSDSLPIRSFGTARASTPNPFKPSLATRGRGKLQLGGETIGEIRSPHAELFRDAPAEFLPGSDRLLEATLGGDLFATRWWTASGSDPTSPKRA
jgi:hypothetical protein